MELPTASVPIDYSGSSDSALEQLPIAEAECKIFDAVEPVAAASDEDIVHFEPVNSMTSGVALSPDGLERAVWLGARNKIFLNCPGDALDSGLSCSDNIGTREMPEDLIDIHLMGDQLILVTRRGVAVFDPRTLAIRILTFDNDYQLAAPMPGFKPSSLFCSKSNELVCTTYNELSSPDYFYRLMFHSNRDIRTVCKIPMNRLYFYSIFAVSEKFTALITEARTIGDEKRLPTIKLFTTAQLDALSEKDHGMKEVVPAITHTLPRMPVDAVILSPDETSLFVACMIDGNPALIQGLIGDSTISFVKRYAAPAQAWNIFWPAKAAGPYISHDPDENRSSQLILLGNKGPSKRKTNESEETGKIQKLEQ